MAGSITNRLRNAWNTLKELSNFRPFNAGSSSYSRPDRVRFTGSNEKSIVVAIYTRIAIDCAASEIIHAKINDQGFYEETLSTELNRLLTLSANIDQTGRALIQDIVMSMLDEGVVAVIPTEYDLSPELTNAFTPLSLRVGKITEWWPRHVRVRVYNEATGLSEEVVVDKSYVAIIENPFYSVMNERSSTLKRLTRKLNILDAIDEQSGSGKLDIIIQLPYALKNEFKKAQAEERRLALESQLAGSRYGIGYSDATEKIVQLNRPAENNMMAQITYLTSMLYGQLSMSEAIINGTASDAEILNYMNRTIDVILTCITDELKRKFLTLTAITQGQTIMYRHNFFKFCTAAQLAEMADKFTRNSIVTSNEFRGAAMKMGPSKEKVADELSNKNIKQDPQKSQIKPEGENDEQKKV